MYTFIYKILVNAAFVSQRYSEAVHLLYVAMLRCEIFFRTPFYANIWAVFVKYVGGGASVNWPCAPNTKTRRVFWIVHWHLRLNVSSYFVSNFFFGVNAAHSTGRVVNRYHGGRIPPKYTFICGMDSNEPGVQYPHLSAIKVKNASERGVWERIEKRLFHSPQKWKVIQSHSKRAAMWRYSVRRKLTQHAFATPTKRFIAVSLEDTPLVPHTW